jgi:type I restriction enzyme, S subunit
MNPDRLLAHFDRLADTPDAIPRLRRFMLDLAVRGKLVEQDPNDEPVSQLLRRLSASEDDHAEKSERASFVIPETWCWVKLGRIAKITMGQSPPGTTYNRVGNGIPLINGPVEFRDGPFGTTVINQYTTAPTNLCNKGDLLLCVRGSTDRPRLGGPVGKLV